MYKDRKTKAVVRLLELASRFNRLAKACPRQCRESYYKMKDNALQRAFKLAPEQFFVDTPTNPSGIIGVTHKQSRRRFHIQSEKWQ